jgi:glycosyltransferase involved in cell wall biosynthesis
MKVLQIIHQDPRKPLGGSESYTGRLIRALAKNKVEVGAFFRCVGDHGMPLKTQRDGSTLYYSTDLSALPTASDRFQFNNSFANPEVLKIFDQVLRRFNPDLVHVQHLVTLSVDILNRLQEKRIPVVATLHDYWYFCHRITLTLPDGTTCPGPRDGLRCGGCGKTAYNHFPGIFLQPGQAVAAVRRNRRLIQALNLCHRIYAPSHHLLARYRAQGLDPNLMRHWPYGMDKPRSVERKRTGPPVFGFIGQLAEHKGVHVMIDALSKLNGTSVKMRIHGDGDPVYLDRLQKSADGLPVEFAGRFEHSQLGSILRELDALVVPSLWEENSPLVIHEASAHGIPVIASSIGGLAEMVDERRGGLLFPTGDSDGLGRIMQELAESGEKLAQMRERVRTIRPLDREVNDLIGEYKALLKSLGN